jgi:hypothetical protein
MLACRGPVLTPGETALIMCIVVLWAASFVIALANICLIVFLNRGWRFKVTNLAAFLAYAAPTASLVAGWRPPGHVWEVVAVFVAPITAVGQFGLLLQVRRGLRKERLRATHLKEATRFLAAGLERLASLPFGSRAEQDAWRVESAGIQQTLRELPEFEYPHEIRRFLRDGRAPDATHRKYQNQIVKDYVRRVTDEPERANPTLHRMLAPLTWSQHR